MPSPVIIQLLLLLRVLHIHRLYCLRLKCLGFCLRVSRVSVHLFIGQLLQQKDKSWHRENNGIRGNQCLVVCWTINILFKLLKRSLIFLSIIFSYVYEVITWRNPSKCASLAPDRTVVLLGVYNAILSSTA